jgi:hypothetical protein
MSDKKLQTLNESGGWWKDLTVSNFLFGIACFIAAVLRSAKIAVNLHVPLMIGVVAIYLVLPYLPSVRAILDRPLFRRASSSKVPIATRLKSPDDAWYVRSVRGASLGPFTASVLRDGLRTGRFYPGVLVRPHAVSDWRSSCDWQELQSAVVDKSTDKMSSPENLD